MHGNDVIKHIEQRGPNAPQREEYILYTDPDNYSIYIACEVRRYLLVLPDYCRPTDLHVLVISCNLDNQRSSPFYAFISQVPCISSFRYPIGRFLSKLHKLVGFNYKYVHLEYYLIR